MTWSWHEAQLNKPTTVTSMYEKCWLVLLSFETFSLTFYIFQLLAGKPESEFQTQTPVTVLIRRLFHITDWVVIYFTGALEPQHLQKAGTVCRICSELPSSSSQTWTTANQIKPGGQTCCPLRLIYCCSKETLTADHRQVRRVLLSTAWRVGLNLLYTHIVVSYRNFFTVNLSLH